MPYDFSICKFCTNPGAAPRYKIDDGLIIYCCPFCGAHYVDRLDDNIPSVPTNSKPQEIAEKDFEYIDKELYSNINRFRNQTDLLLASCRSTNLDTSNLNILDVGAGGGLFMHLLNEHGVSTHGIDPNTLRQAFAKNIYGLELSPHLIEDAYWQDGFSGYFDAVTMWDVIEHVDFPRETLICANKL